MSKKNWLLLALFICHLFFLRVKTLVKKTPLPGQKIKITARLSQEPRFTSSRQIFTLAGVKINTWRYPEYHFGEKLVATGMVGKDGLANPEIQRIGEAEGALTSLASFKRKTEKVFRQSLPEPQASLLAGMVLGSKSDFPKEFYQALQETGTLHVVVASGMNVTMLAGFLLSLLVTFINRRRAVLITMIMIWFYVFLVGFEAPIVRAGIMGTLAFTAMGLGRLKDAFWALVFAGIVMLFVNPSWLFDLSFQLSFASTLGILVLGQRLKRILKLPLVGDDLATTLAAQAGILPFMLFAFGGISVLSPVVNGLVLWVVPLVTAGGMVLGILGLLSGFLGRVGLLLLFPPLTFFVKTVELMARR